MTQSNRLHVDELRFELLPHPPYSPHLAPSDFCLFADLEKMLQENRFGFDNEVIAATVVCFEAKDNLYYKKCGMTVFLLVSPGT